MLAEHAMRWPGEIGRVGARGKRQEQPRATSQALKQMPLLLLSVGSLLRVWCNRLLHDERSIPQTRETTASPLVWKNGLFEIQQDVHDGSRRVRAEPVPRFLVVNRQIPENFGPARLQLHQQFVGFHTC